MQELIDDQQIRGLREQWFLPRCNVTASTNATLNSSSVPPTCFAGATTCITSVRHDHGRAPSPASGHVLTRHTRACV